MDVYEHAMRVYAGAIGEDELILRAEVPRSQQIVFSVHKSVRITRAWSMSKSWKVESSSKAINHAR